MNRIRLLAFFVLVFIIFIISVIIFFLSSPQPQPPPQTVIIPTKIPPPLPTTDKILISGIPINNPYISPVQRDAQGDSLMTRGETYNLVYLKPFNEFLISITSSPFEINRQLAEQAFLERLGITKEQACQLTVTITTPVSVNNAEAGQKYPLSFCP
ncbi:MAG: hypothetical protein KBC00_00685 [Candidatus Levybacteria bacterium]|nr:hypothetical protein [Candidatus Levybacteria bacterium]MBP9814710.1 hypothetical protein [Candidatus Levybacteria bacterium]